MANKPNWKEIQLTEEQIDKIAKPFIRLLSKALHPESIYRLEDYKNKRKGC